jgi:hypothetical protein
MVDLMDMGYGNAEWIHVVQERVCRSFWEYIDEPWFP